MRRSFFAFALGACFAFFSLAQACAQEPISISQTSSTSQILGNGNTEITFVAVVSLNVIPIAFNFHWERSDRARTAVRVISVRNAGEQTYTLVEKWTVGPNVAADQLWEKVFVNSGNTHLASDPIMAGAAAEASAPAATPAPAPEGAHPAYLHSLSDLRLARALLIGWVNPLIMIQLHQASGEIEAAIREITAAAISDGKNIDDHPPIDAVLDNRNRLIRSLELLNSSYSDIDQRETNPADSGLRSRALGHISKAREAINEARRMANWF